MDHDRRQHVIVLCALEIERRWLARFSSGRYDPPHCCGPGMDNVRRWLDEHRPASLVFAGLAGALNPQVHAGSAFVIREVIDKIAGDRWRPAQVAANTPTCSVVSTDSIVTLGRDRAALNQSCGADLVDMESSAVARWATQSGIPWAIVRGVSDDCSGGGAMLPPQSADWVDSHGRTKFWTIARAVIRRPAIIGDLMKLRRTSRQAMINVADLVATLCRQSSIR